MVKETYGLYSLIKKNVFTGQQNKYPEWTKIHEPWISQLFLCGCWTDIDEDKIIVEEITGLSYSDIESKLFLLQQGEEPFLISYRRFGKKTYRLLYVVTGEK